MSTLTRPSLYSLHALFSTCNRTLSFWVISFGFLLAVLNPIRQSFAAELVGTIPGRFSVSQTGAAKYQIPIDTPAATGGLRPSLALTYNHRGGTGIAGQGWKLSGISRISRCPKTLAQDNEIRGVEYDLDDRFCLDGQRLVVISGTYGGAGSEYRTEIESFKKIVANGVQGNGPKSFTVWDRDGIKHSYGDLQESSLTDSTTNSYRFWARYRTEDQYGNELNYQYDANETSGEFLLDFVIYTKNTAQSLSERYKVVFTYEERVTSDKRSGYLFGSLWSRNYRLDNIDVQHYDSSWASISDYELGYATGTSGRSQLTSVRRSAGADILPTTIFEWQDAVADWETESSSGQSSSGHSNPLVGDFNNDGQEDLFVVKGGEWHILTASGGDFAAPIDTNKSAPNPQYTMAFDYNGDGKTDLLVPGSDSKWHIYESTGTAFTDVNTNVATTGYTESYAQDVDGDGLDDLLYRSGSRVYLRKSTGSGLEATATSVLYNIHLESFIGSSKFAIDNQIDFNGDGRGDIIAYDFEEEYDPEEPPMTWESWQTYVFDGTGYSYHGLVSLNDVLPVPVDINGDGLTDVAFHKGVQWRTKISTGSGLGAISSSGVAITDYEEEKAVFADYDADGRQDLIRATSSNWVVHKSAGEYFSTFGTNIGGPSPLTSQAIQMDVAGNGHDELVMSYSNLWQIRDHKSPLPDVVTKFTDGLGNYFEPDYSSTATMNHYYEGGSVTFPDQRIERPMFVVDDYDANDGIGGTYTIDFKYWNAKKHVQGRGSLGFSAIHEIDNRDGTYKRSVYLQSFPFIGRLEQRYFRQDTTNDTDYYVDDPAWSATTLGAGSAEREFVRMELRTMTTYEVGGALDGQEVRKVVRDPTYESTYGNVTTETITTTSAQAAGDTYTTTLDYQLANYPTARCLGLRTQVKITRSAPGATTESRTTDNTFDPTDCHLLTRTNVSDTDTNLQLKTTLTYDAFGNAKTVTLDSVNGADDDRKLEFFYDQWGHLLESRKSYIDSLTDPEISWTWDYELARPLSTTDIRGQETSWIYDEFGRVTSETKPDGTSTTISYSECASPCEFSNGEFYVKTLQSGGFERRDFIDSYGRTVGGWRYLPTGAKSNYKLEYDQIGRIDNRYIPWVDGETNFYIDLDYDLISRLVEEDKPIDETTTTGSTTTIAYQGLSQTITKSVNTTQDQDTVYEYDPIGRIVLVTDELNGEVEYEYTAFDELHKTWDPSNNLTTINHNDRGDKTSMIVPGMLESTCGSARSSASISLSYNVFGEVTSQLDAACQETTFEYNQLGLITDRVDDDGGSNEGTTTWNYYTTSDHKLWLPSSISSPGSITEAYSYDSLSRVEDITTTIDSTDYEIDFSYHTTGSGKGLLKRITYPESTASVRHTVDYDYDNWGFLEKVKDGGTPTNIYFQLHGTDAVGRERLVELNEDGNSNEFDVDWDYDTANGFLESIQTGPNLSATLQDLTYEWDRLGNLKARTDVNQSVTETFTYDGLNRIDTVKLDTDETLDVDYDAVGNIESKSDVGDYEYNDGPYAVSDITGTRAATYHYDDNGNMDVRDGDTITWHPFNKPKRINFGSDFAEFTYGSNRSRLKQYNKTGSTYTTTYYIGGIYEKETSGGVTKHRHNILANGKTVAIYTRPSSGSITTRYVLRDHQSSVVEVIDDQGASVESISVDAFGKRRNSDWSADTTDTQFSVSHLTERGYTGHEHLDNTRLIHMNGRVQDPIIGRMISADPFVPDPFNGQSLDRYSYVINNPVTLMDPSGFRECFDECSPLRVRDWQCVSNMCYDANNFDPDNDIAAEWDRIEEGSEMSEFTISRAQVAALNEYLFRGEILGFDSKIALEPLVKSGAIQINWDSPIVPQDLFTRNVLQLQAELMLTGDRHFARFGEAINELGYHALLVGTGTTALRGAIAAKIALQNSKTDVKLLAVLGVRLVITQFRGGSGAAIINSANSTIRPAWLITNEAAPIAPRIVLVLKKPVR